MKKNMHCASGWWVVLLTATLAVSAMAGTGASLYNSSLSQVITSSTLKWTNLKKENINNYVTGATSPQGKFYTDAINTDPQNRDNIVRQD